MSRSNIVLSVGLSLALAAGAGAATKSASHATKHAGVKTLTGCLEKGDEANTFKLTHVADSKEDWELMEAPASLKMAEHVGHKVEVSGSSMSTHTAAKEEKVSTSKEAGEHEYHLKVTSMKHIGPTCP